MASRDDLLSASKRANEVIEEFDLKKRIKEGGYTRIDPTFAASQAGVPVMYRKLDKLLGGFIRDGLAVGILVNHDRSRGLVHMTCAHELGHFFLGHESTADDKMYHDEKAQLVERTADQFAYSLLAPRWLIARTMAAHRWSMADLANAAVVYQLSLRMGTSYTATIWSLQRTGVIPVTLARRLQAVAPADVKREALGGAQLDDAKSDVWVLGPADKDCVLEPGYGDRFVVDLGNHATAGYLWSLDEAASQGFTLQPLVLDARLESAPRPAEVVVGGGAPTLRYTLAPPARYRQRVVLVDNLDPLSQRRNTVSLGEHQAWQNVSAKEDMLAFHVEFEPTNSGFTVNERLHRVNLERLSDD